MRHHLLSAVLATICIGAASPVLAEDADCGLLCRINGYLSTDHMAAGPNDGGATAAPKGHRAHVAHKAATKPAPKLADKGKTPVATAAETAKPAPAKLTTAKPAAAKASPALAARVTPPPAKFAAAPDRATAHPRTAALPTHAAEPQVVAEASPVPAKQPVHRRSASTRPPVQAAHAQTASVIIPGAAPAMPMGFQPFTVAFH